MFWLTPWHDPAHTPLYMIMLGFTVFLALRTLLIYTPVERWTRRSTKPVYRVDARAGAGEVGFALRSFAVDVVMLSLLVKSDIARIDERNWMFTAVASFVVLEVWFYALHRALHTRALFFIHRAHHETRIVRPLTGMAFSALERALIILGFAAAMGALSFVHPIAPGGIALYFLFNYTLNMIGHGNAELFPPSLGWLVGPTHHAMHHARFDGHYGLHLTWLDRWLKTEFPDYAAVRARVWAGKSLNTIAERAEAPDVAISEMKLGLRPLDGLVDAEALRPRLLMDLPATNRWLAPRVTAWLAREVTDPTDAREWYTWAPLEGPLTLSEISELTRTGVISADTVVFSPKREGALRAGDLPAPPLALRPPIYVNRRSARQALEKHVRICRADVGWSGLTTNVSAQGAALVLDAAAPLVPGDVVTLDIEGLSLPATVVGLRAAESTLLCALEFRGLRSAQRSAWAGLLRAGQVSLSA